MVVALNLPVDVLLGTDLYETSVLKEGQVQHGLIMLMKVQRRGKEQMKREKQTWEDKKEPRGKDDDETEDEANWCKRRCLELKFLSGERTAIG